MTSSWHCHEWKQRKHIEAEKNGRYFAGEIFKCIFLTESIYISMKVSSKFVPKCPAGNKLSLVQTSTGINTEYDNIKWKVMVRFFIRGIKYHFGLVALLNNMTRKW